MKNQKIILINTIPSSLEGLEKPRNVPIAILSLGTWLTKKSNFKVKLIDCLVEKDYLNLIKKEISNGDVLIVGVSVMSSCIPNALKITRMIKKINSKQKIIWGGIHCRLYPEQTIKHKDIDFLAYGEGEKTILNLANCLSKNKPYNKVKGLMYKQDKKIITTPSEDFTNLDELGMMNYELLNPSVLKRGRVVVLSSRGCPHRCTFCINVAIKNRCWRFLSAENVAKEVEYLVKKYDVKIVNFGDECFFVNKQRAEKIFDLFLKKNLKLKYAGAARADYFSKGLLTQEMLGKMKKLGFYDVAIGSEFGNQKMLDFIKKDITPEDTLLAVKMLKKADIGATYSFMTGFPNETKEDTLATIKLIKQISKIEQGFNIVKKIECFKKF